MTGTPPTWAVAALGDEPAPLIAAFARHHLAIGAAEVHVFLDRPNPEVEKLIGDRDGVSITTCDQSYWARVNNGKRPERHTGRQKFVSTSVYNTSSCDWLLHCDVDEFIADGTALSKALGKADRTKGLVIRNAERVYLPGAPGEMLFEGGFRQPVALEEDEMQSLYGRFSKFLSQGFTGHRTGKTIVPTGQAWEMGVHYPKILADGSRPPVVSTERRLLLHFDGLTPLHYAIKLLKKSFENYSGPKRKLGAAREAQYRFARNHADRPREILRLVEGVQSLDTRQAESLLALDRLRLDPFMPKDCDDLDLTRATFDALLRERDGEILAKAGLDM
ncbi:glycosyltransferase family 2 protein [Celeribacter sp. PS-C1]|uniref:glycosyltransferase family 2 protein n=1 Tax=Celeribacter sp. PS-C1 TaxID=2820813 RepID=UPI001C6757CE|nr:glycosyltransferase family 2 protein [Celeribacter sp. PS-C1]MBW6418990.1 glycosyltransferase family 2 protein [Celeribacter sp. PS-C1]